MSLITEHIVDIDGKEVCGQVMRACEEESTCAFYELANCSVGVSYKTASRIPHLRICPTIAIPKSYVDGIDKFKWGKLAEDKRWADVQVDPADGEVYATPDVRARRKQTVEGVLADWLPFIDQVVYPALMGYIGDPDNAQEDEVETSICF